MNGPARMYPLAEIVHHDLPIELPTCMYRMKNLHSDSGSVDSDVDSISTQNNLELSGMAELLQKQERILKQLEDLRQQMMSIRQTLKQSSSVPTSSIEASSVTSGDKNINLKNLPDIVINASPQHPPYSLLFLKKLWAGSVDLCVSSHIHSTVTALPDNAKQLCESLSQVQTCNGLPKVFVRLIWKDVGINQLELLISTTPILGEGNFLRYIARVTSLLGYNERNIEMDSVLDISYSILHAKTKAARALLLQHVNKRLGKSKYLFGDAVTVADVAVYSAVKQSVSSSDVNGNLSKWMQRCEV